MFLYQLAYRWANGDVEGFVGSSPTSADTAERNALALIAQKARDIVGEQWTPDSVIRHESRVTVAELATIKADWKLMLGKGAFGAY